MEGRIYIAIDLKSFYASVECADRGLDPLTTNLVVADESRSAKTICLAVSPALKAYGIPGRPRLFEVIRQIGETNRYRLKQAPGRRFSGESSDKWDLLEHPEKQAAFVIAPPRMAHYVQRSAEIYQIYLKHIAPEDIHVYSIDEVFIDATTYLELYHTDAHAFARMLMREVRAATGITATAGIGTNLYLAKAAMDIVAKKLPPDPDGIRVAWLDETEYRCQLWDHTPLTDFWRVGRGYAKKLQTLGLHTMGELARFSLTHEEALYAAFGVNAELLVDHAWGWEPCTIADVKAYRPESNSIGSGQVLQQPYSCEKARLVVREMAEQLALDLVERGLKTDQMVLTIGYDRENLTEPAQRARYHGEIVTDPYGRSIPKHGHGTANLEEDTASAQKITEAVMALFDRIADPELLVRRLNLTACHVNAAEKTDRAGVFEQLDLFTDLAAEQEKRRRAQQALEREQTRQKTVLTIKKRFGKNAILKGMDLEEGATAADRNDQIGGHKA